MKRVIGYFMKGLLVFVPAALTIFAIVWTFTKLDSIFRGLFRLEQPGLGLALGLAATLGLITAIGAFASNFIGGALFKWVDGLLKRVPLIRLLYSSVKDFVEAFAGDRKSFDRPVIVEILENGPKAVGFVTRDDLRDLGLSEEVAVYLPQSYNFAGSLFLFAKERVKPLGLDSSSTMAFILSGGVASTAGRGKAIAGKSA